MSLYVVDVYTADFWECVVQNLPLNSCGHTATWSRYDVNVFRRQYCLLTTLLLFDHVQSNAILLRCSSLKKHLSLVQVYVLSHTHTLTRAHTHTHHAHAHTPYTAVWCRRCCAFMAAEECTECWPQGRAGRLLGPGQWRRRVMSVWVLILKRTLLILKRTLLILKRILPIDILNALGP